MTSFLSDQSRAMILCTAVLSVIAGLGLFAVTIPRSILFDHMMAQPPGPAFVVVQLATTGQSVLWSLVPPLLLLALPLAKGWRVGLAVVAFGLIWTGPALIASDTSVRELRFRPTDFASSALVMLAPVLGLGIFLTARAYGRKAAWLLAALGLFLMIWNVMNPRPDADSRWILWLLAILGLTLHKAKTWPGGALPWILLLTLPALIPWLWIILPDLGSAIMTRPVSEWPSALGDLLVFDPPLYGASLLTVGSFAVLGALAAFHRGGGARRGDWLVVGGLSLAYALFEVFFNRTLGFSAEITLYIRFPTAFGHHMLVWIATVLPALLVLATLATSLWLYFRRTR